MGLSPEFPNITNMPQSHAVVSCPCNFYCFADAAETKLLYQEHLRSCERAFHAPPEVPRSAREVITLKAISALQLIAIIVIISWIWLKAGGII